MRTSELLGRRVVTDDGRDLGIVHDLRVLLPGDGGALRLTGVVTGPATHRARLAHAWGYAAERAQGPGLVRWWLCRGLRQRVVSPRSVVSWDRRGDVVVSGTAVTP